VISYQVKVGDFVKAGQHLGEIVDIEDVDAERVPIVSQTDGIIFGLRPHVLAIPGEIAIKVAGQKPLDWRKGNLLTSK
jgi:predicted deacylase